jgi:hypothetical protein
MRTMAIGDVRPQEQHVQDQPSSSSMVQPSTHNEKQVPQGDGMDQGGAQEQERREEEEVPQAPSEREMCPWAISKCFGDLVSNTSA